LKNCSRCTRWRRFCDFRVTKCKRGAGEYLGNICWLCEKLATRARALRNYYKNHALRKAKQRSLAAQRRRETGVQEKGKYKRKEPVVQKDNKIDLLLRYGPRK
jgi:hypothetical protein